MPPILIAEATDTAVRRALLPLADAQSVHSQRRTAFMASVNLTVTLPSQSTPDACSLSAGNDSYHSAPTLYHPKQPRRNSLPV
jgi:hypothetical protein